MIPKRCIIHHSGISIKDVPLQFNHINDYHKSRWNRKSSLGFFGGYSLLIEATGKIKRYRKDNERGIHCYRQNDDSIGICMAGNFDVELPTEEQKQSLRKLLLNYNLKSYPHRAFRNTHCFGMKLSDTWIEDLMEDDMPNIDYSRLSKLYTAVFHRPIDEDGKKYAGKDIDFIIDEFIKSKEWRAYDYLNKAAKEIEKLL